MSWSSGKIFGGLTATVVKDQTRYQVLRIAAHGKAVIALDNLKRKGPFQDEAVLQELLDRINLIPQADFKPGAWKFQYDLEALVDPGSMLAFQQACEWVIARINESQQQSP